MPVYPFVEEGSPTKIGYRKKGALILTSLLEELVALDEPQVRTGAGEAGHGGEKNRGLRAVRSASPGCAARIRWVTGGGGFFPLKNTAPFFSSRPDI